MENLKKKSQRTSKAQFEIYNKYIEKYPVLLSGKLKPAEGPDHIQSTWKELTATLNAAGMGPSKICLQNGNPPPERKLDQFDEKPETREKPCSNSTTQKQKSKKKVANELLDAYKQNQAEYNQGLMHVADALNNIAEESYTRSKKASAEHFLLYLDYLSSCKNNDLNKENNFNELIVHLNSMKGPYKTAAEWNKTFKEWVSRTKQKARNIYIHQRETGGGMPINQFLTSIEEKLLSIISVIGMDVQELGIIKLPSKLKVKKVISTKLGNKRIRMRK
ncbi:hypothetical protein MML48_9g00000304 [Holotrichia oblita]|uniref:Uncharacterized protein n=1 Tax=Holotrichia oblita TaxID=644536 RepID=A0ACB9SLS8_HOLOL|nr:hypothetical protein MML48_9g00000304 [Holotrichia oblita]